MFQLYVDVADWCWSMVSKWDSLAVDTVGKQLIRAVDSIGANLVEGDGRYTDPDSLHFFVIARASAREARYWLQRASIRGLILPADINTQLVMLTTATKMLNALMRYRRTHPYKKGSSASYMIPETIAETPASYIDEDKDPFVVD